jgi:hypothetical protein
MKASLAKEPRMRRTSLAVLAIGLAGAPAAAEDLPARRAGLWEMRMSVDGGNAKPQVSEHCIDAETDKQMQSLGGSMGKDLCGKQDVRRVGSTLVVDSVCKLGAMTTSSRAEISGDFNSAYTVKVSTRREGGAAVPGLDRDGNITIKARWTGACKADQKPGDMIMAGGRKINVRDLQSLPAMLQQTIRRAGEAAQKK